MAKVLSPEAVAEEAEKKRLKEEKDRLKKERKAQKKEAKRRASEISREEEAFDEGGNGLVTRGDIWFRGQNIPDLSEQELRKIRSAPPS